MAAANASAHAQTSDTSPASTSLASSPADWTQFHRDNMQRWNPYEIQLGVGNVGGLQLKWSFDLGVDAGPGFPTSSPTVVNGVAYIGSWDRSVYALNASTGAKLWSYRTASEVTTAPAVVNGVVYVGSADSNVYALNASTGALLWRFATGNNVTSSPTVVNGVLYVGSYDGYLYALNASTGAKLWSYNLAQYSVDNSPAVVNGVVYFSDFQDNVYALNASTGAKLWSHYIGSALGSPNGAVSSAAVANGVVYIGSQDTNVYALNASTGDTLWSFPTGGVAVWSSPAVANGAVYIGVQANSSVPAAGKVYALDARTGAKLWSFTVAGKVYSSPAVANGIVYVGSADGNVYALNASTGARLFSYATKAPVNSSPAVVSGVVYVQSGRNVFALGLGGSADLFLRINPSPTPVAQGELLTYAFPVWNLGPGNATHEVLTTQVPAGTTFDYLRVSGTPGLATCSRPPYGGTGTIVCHENGTMAPNTTWTVRLAVKVTAPSGTVITESGQVTADTADPNLANNTATVSDAVQ
jgi:outer membrane protein assembly factor BamB